MNSEYVQSQVARCALTGNGDSCNRRCVSNTPLVQEARAQEKGECSACFVLFADLQCRFDDGCWWPLCRNWNSGRGRAAMCSSVWLTLAAVETTYVVADVVESNSGAPGKLSLRLYRQKRPSRWAAWSRMNECNSALPNRLRMRLDLPRRESRVNKRNSQLPKNWRSTGDGKPKRISERSQVFDVPWSSCR